MSAFKGFSKVKLTKPQKSTFDLSHDVRLSCHAGNLVPVLVTECVPSDKFNGSTEMLVRLAPLLAPIYDQIIVYVHFFFVPYRLLWEDWEEFITGGRLGVGVDPVNAPVPPFCDMEDLLTFGVVKSQLADYLGVPILPLAGETAADYAGINLDVMPFAAYQAIWMEYYRDRNFEADDYVTLPLASGQISNPDLNNIMSTQVRSYSHDYFTSALPFTQRGEEVLMPLAGTGAVTYLDQSLFKKDDGTTWSEGVDVYAGAIDDATGLYGFRKDTGAGITGGRIENIDEVELTASSVSINDFRSAYALQVWLERNAVGGSRYTESTQAHFGVRPQDSRLQRPEYIGGGRINVRISEVVSTAWSNNADDDSVPQANMAGHGVSYGNTNTFSYFCAEHGFIMGLMSIMVPGSYHQGLPKMFRRRSFLDYPWPTFAKLGEQQVDKAEIYANHTTLTEDDNGVLPLFGYQSRYADWKYIANRSCGDFHDTLLFWTATRDFAAVPTLNAGFNLFDQTSVNRMFAVNDGSDNFWVYIHNRLTVNRPLPYFGTPNTLGFV